MGHLEHWGTSVVCYQGLVQRSDLVCMRDAIVPYKYIIRH